MESYRVELREAKDEILIIKAWEMGLERYRSKHTKFLSDRRIKFK
jgi:hypothetical protein